MKLNSGPAVGPINNDRRRLNTRLPGHEAISASVPRTSVWDAVRYPRRGLRRGHGSFRRRSGSPRSPPAYLGPSRPQGSLGGGPDYENSRAEGCWRRCGWYGREPWLMPDGSRGFQPESGWQWPRRHRERFQGHPGLLRARASSPPVRRRRDRRPETDDSHSFLCKRNEEHVNLLLVCAVAALSLAHGDTFSA